MRRHSARRTRRIDNIWVYVNLKWYGGWKKRDILLCLPR